MLTRRTAAAPRSQISHRKWAEDRDQFEKETKGTVGRDEKQVHWPYAPHNRGPPDDYGGDPRKKVASPKEQQVH